MSKDKRIIQILSDLEYWDTCPQSLKEELPDLITHLESKDNSVLHSIMPRTLTAENGAKALLNGEFFETTEVDNPEYCGCGWCEDCSHGKGLDNQTYQIEVPVQWSTIKSIYNKIVEKYGA